MPMSINLFVGIVSVFSAIVGFIAGWILIKYFNAKQNNEILKNAKEVLEGKRENILEIEGKKYNATKFIVLDEDGKEKLIDLKKGGQEQDVKLPKKEEQTEKTEDQVPEIKPPKGSKPIKTKLKKTSSKLKPKK